MKPELIRENLKIDLMILDALLTKGDPRWGRRNGHLQQFLDGHSYFLSDGGKSYLYIHHGVLCCCGIFPEDTEIPWASEGVMSVRNRIQEYLDELAAMGQLGGGD